MLKQIKNPYNATEPVRAVLLGFEAGAGVVRFIINPFTRDVEARSRPSNVLPCSKHPEQPQQANIFIDIN